jgi:tetratricopeptide (TPR) repeat protein
MKKHLLFVLAIASLFPVITGCKKELRFEEVWADPKRQPATILEQIDESEAIYYTDNKKKYTENNRMQAEKLRLEGFACYKKKLDTEAIAFYVKSLKEYPKAETYYNLGNSLMNRSLDRYAALAYLVALKYRPDERNYNYNLACAYSLGSQIDESLKYLKIALEKGYNNYEYIQNDPDMSNTRKAAPFYALIKQYSAVKLTSESVINERYTAVNYGHYSEIIEFMSSGECSTHTEGYGPYAEAFKGNEKSSGTWEVRNGLLYVKLENQTESILYLDLGQHTASY